MPKRAVTIYMPAAAGLFRRSVRRSGGAERQMALLAGELARRCGSVALVVNRVADPIPDIEPGLTLVERGPREDAGGALGSVIEAARVLRALVTANGRVVVVRGGTPVLGFVAVYCRLWRRRLVFSSANDFDFLPRPTSRIQARLYSFGVRSADAVVVQSLDQVELARNAFPTIKRLVCIPSFAELAPETADRPDPTSFVWAGRLVDYKRPELCVDLAAAVPEARFLMIANVGSKREPWQEEALARLAAAAARAPNLELGEGIPHSELVEKFSTAVAVVNTSEFEGMPNTFLEAWGQGVPVLTFSFDPAGVVAEKRLGIAAGGSWDAFVDGARSLWEERGDRSDYADRTRAHIRDVHSRQAVGSRWEELLASLLAFEHR